MKASSHRNVPTSTATSAILQAGLAAASDRSIAAPNRISSG
jgi:hypothetical protein